VSIQKIALAQINPLLGDLAGNAQLIHKAALEAYSQGAKLVITPELSLTGYPPEDLLLRPAFIEAAEQELTLLMQQLAPYSDLTVIVGHPKQTPIGLQNYASVLRGGKVIAGYAKQELPNHEVFDEVRYFVPGDQACVFECEGARMLGIPAQRCKHIMLEHKSCWFLTLHLITSKKKLYALRCFVNILHSLRCP
jgi:NAD+ synthase (glutamine-hydrolysing)